jgi:hypothetical protein
MSKKNLGPLDELAQTLGELHAVMRGGADLLKKGRKIAKVAGRILDEEDAPRARRPAGPAADVELEDVAPVAPGHPAADRFDIQRAPGERLRFVCRKCAQGFLVRERAASAPANLATLGEHAKSCTK